jgi:hypothetical protein
MKKSLFRPLITWGIWTGPPSVNPYWFHLNGLDFGVSGEGVRESANLLSRRNSKTDP